MDKRTLQGMGEGALTAEQGRTGMWTGAIWHIEWGGSTWEDWAFNLVEGGQGNVVQGPLPQGFGLKLPTEQSPRFPSISALGRLLVHSLGWLRLSTRAWDKGAEALEQPNEVQAGLEDRLDPRLGQGVATTDDTIFTKIITQINRAG